MFLIVKSCQFWLYNKIEQPVDKWIFVLFDFLFYNKGNKNCLPALFFLVS